MSPERAKPRLAHPTGFTLVELLVVIFIISLLVAATLTIVPKVRKAVFQAETQAQLSALANAIQQYYGDFKSYPGPLPNNQLNANADGNTQPNMADPANSANPPLFLIVDPATSFMNTNNIPSNMNTTRAFITGSQNLVLGLLGGLEYISNTDKFVYSAQDIFSDGHTPAPRGPASLNPANPKRQQSYIQVKAGDISVPDLTYNSGNGASFVDSTADLVTADKRSPQDAMIPVFLDKYSDPLPILYYRTNVGGTAIAGIRSKTNYFDDSGSPLQDPNLAAMGNAPNQTPQYDLVQNLPYVSSAIGTIGNNTNSFHGLMGLGSATQNLSDPIDVRNGDGTYSPKTVGGNKGYNGIAYFKDPSLNPPYDPAVDTTTANTPSNVHLGTARQKDGFLLISAGPDRLYGTHDDNINPGGAP